MVDVERETEVLRKSAYRSAGATTPEVELNMRSAFSLPSFFSGCRRASSALYASLTLDAVAAHRTLRTAEKYRAEVGNI